MVEPVDYIERWRRTVIARREQHDAACAGLGRTTGDYWARRAEGYQKFVSEWKALRDPFLDLLLRHLKPSDAVLDVGAGTGRHTLPLAGHAKRIIALDPSAAMLRFLREGLEAQSVENVEVVEGGWPEAADRVPPVAVAISAHVLYPIEEIVPFLRALDAKAARLCFLHLMGRQPWFDQLGLWEAVHGSPRAPQPTYIDAVNVLHQLGCYANVEVAWADVPRTFESLDEAIERFAETVAVGEDEGQLHKLRQALSERLLPVAGGLRMDIGPYPLASVWWEAGQLQKG
jgi:SAM-dependent methyltransferase